MDNYKERKNDNRFKKWDNAIKVNNNDRKVNIILIVGVIICSILMVSSLISQIGKPTPMKYDYGLNISYDVHSSSYYIDYKNPNTTTTFMNVNIKTPYGSSEKEYTTVYSTSSSTFPVNISYKPYNKDYEHTISVILSKSSGNYTYTFTNIPSNDEKMYDGVTKYTEFLNNQITNLNITLPS